METYRESIKNALMHKLPEKIASNYEKHIYKMCNRIIDNESGFSDLEEAYKIIAYEKVGQLLVCKNRREREKILEDIKSNIYGFDTKPYSEYKNKRKLLTSSMAQGPRVEKGEFPCRNPKCRSKECFFYTFQTRSIDEPATIFVTCSKCKTRYRM